MLHIQRRAIGFAEPGIAPWSASLRFDVGSLDDLAPLLGFFGDELFEVGGRAPEHDIVPAVAREVAHRERGAKSSESVNPIASRSAPAPSAERTAQVVESATQMFLAAYRAKT